MSRAKSQAHDRPVADRIKHTNIFIERAKKRVASFQQDVTNAQAAVVQAQEKLAEEEALLRDGEVRLQVLMHEESNQMECQDVPPTVSCNFASELAQLRACVAELQLERDDLRAKLQNSSVREDRERKQPRTLASSTLDLVPLNHIVTDRSVVSRGSSLWCFRQDGDTHRQRRFVSAKRQPFQSIVCVKSCAHVNEQNAVWGSASGRR